MKIVVMGVTGCGKTTVGIALAEALGIEFIDSDDLHSESNRKKMSSGIPLTDSDREPWLQAVSKTLQNHESIVVACSALKKSYRSTILAGAPTTKFIHLSGSQELIFARLSERSHHFMPIGLLDSQFETLEKIDETEFGKVFDIDKPIDEIVHEVVLWIGKKKNL
jgi:carbohydrate kinase (thermoresistant glucokinase family)